jgi:hypothetical protein
MSNIVFSNSRNSSLLAYKYAKRKLIRLAEGVYSDDVETPAKKQVMQNMNEILTHLGVSGVYNWRSGLGLQDTDSVVYLTGDKARNITMADDVQVSVIPEKKPNEIHRFPVTSGSTIFQPSFHRAVLENLNPAKVAARRSDPDRAKKLLRDYFEKVLRNNQNGLCADMDIFKALARDLDLHSCLDEIQSVADAVSAKAAASMVSFEAVDSTRIKMFEMASEKLSLSLDAVSLENTLLSEQAQINQAFIESYFSNYIEGTEFEVEDAERIVFEYGYNASHERSDDGHDVLSLYHLIREPAVVVSGADSEDYIKLVKAWNKALMGHRMRDAGEFKTRFNGAGNTRFVAPELVHATLRKAFAMAKDLPPGLARAAFLKLVFVEVHPFSDGNGRVSRLLLNNELQQSGKARLIVPNVFREDYLLALKAFSQQSNLVPFERMIKRLCIINASMPKREENLARLIADLKNKSAFCHPSESMWGLPTPEKKSNDMGFAM